MKREFKNYKLVITPLTCLSVTSGETLSACDYDIRQGKFNYIDVNRVFERIYRNEFSPECNALKQETNLDGIKNIIRKNYIESEDVLYSYMCNDITVDDEGCKNLSPIYKVRKGNKLIPVIPGSSIKGAIRTALLSKLYWNADESFRRKLIREAASLFTTPISEGEKRKKVKKVGSNTLDSILTAEDYNVEGQDNPEETGAGKKLNSSYTSFMRSLRFSDAYTEKEKPRIALAKTKILTQKEKKEDNSFTPMLEIMPGDFMLKSGGDSYISSFTTESLTDEKFKDFSTPEGLAAVCNWYSEKVLKEDCEKGALKKILEKDETLQKNVNNVFQAIEDAKHQPGTFILRLGRYSQIEYMTIADENLRVVGEKSTKHTGTSRTVSIFRDAAYPVGWCKFRISDI